MQTITIQVNDRQKAKALRDILSAMDFVEEINLSDGGDEGNTQPLNDSQEGAALYRHPRQADMEREVAAFEALHPQLIASHLGAFVAIREGELIDADPNELALIERVRQRYPAGVILIRKVEQALPPVLNFRSPRLVAS